MQLASANYVNLVQGEAEVQSEPELTKQKREVPLAKEATADSSLKSSSEPSLDKDTTATQSSTTDKKDS